jgi:hypothetical protein
MFPVRYAARPEKLFSMIVSSVMCMLRPKKQLSTTVLYEVRAELKDTVEHACVLYEVHAEAEDTDECECVLYGLSADVEDTVKHDCVLCEV